MSADDRFPSTPPDPTRIATRADFAHALTALRKEAGLSIRQVARLTGIQHSTLGGYYSGEHLPSIGQPHQLPKILRACGVTDPITIMQWKQTLDRTRETLGVPAASVPSPYPGLHAFTQDDAGRFFGREKLTASLIERLALLHDHGGPLFVIGVSGSGKSSLLRAGLIPALRRGDLAVRGSTDWPWLLLTPGRSPVRELATQLAALARVAPEDAEEALRSGPRAAAALARRACTSVKSGDSGNLDPLSCRESRLVVIVDQFEELFTSGSDQADISVFISALHAMAQADGVESPDAGESGHEPPPAVVVFGLRADFYSHALRRSDLQSALRNGHVVVGSMTEGELRNAIVKPARSAGVDLEQGLLELLLRDVGPQLGAGPPEDQDTPDPDGDPCDAGALPLLAHALRATWDRRHRGRMTVADYEASGGIRGAVSRTAEEAFQELGSQSQRELARQLFLRLVHIASESADTRRRASRQELVDDSPRSEELANVLYEFVNRRLVTVSSDHVEIAHESLLFAWPRLREWISADRASLVTHQRLAEAAKNWVDSERDPDVLYRGARLEAATEWARDQVHRFALNQSEQDFLAASVARHEATVRAELRRARRLRQLLAAMVVAALSTSSLAGYALLQRRTAIDQRDVALSREVAIAAEQVRASDVSLAMQLSLVAYRISPTPEARGSLLGSSGSMTATRLLGSGPSEPGSTVSPDGRALVTGDSEGRIRLWNLADPRGPVEAGRLRSGSARQDLKSALFSPDGNHLAVLTADRRLRLWDVRDTSRPVPESDVAGPEQATHSLAFSPDGTLLASGSADGVVRLWNVADARQPAMIGPPIAESDDPVESLAFSPNGRLLAVGGRDKFIRLWDISDPRQPALRAAPIQASTLAIFTLAFSPDGDTLASSGAEGTVHLWDLRNPGHPTPSGTPLVGSASWVNAIAFDHGGSTLVVGSSDGTATLWDLRQRRPLVRLPHPEPVTTVTFGPDDHVLVTGATDGVTRLWRLPGPLLADPTDRVFTVAFDPTGDLLAAGSNDGKVWLWDVSRPRQPVPIQPLASPSDGVRYDGAIAFSPDGHSLAVGSIQGVVHVWDVADPRRARIVQKLVEGSQDTIESVAFSPDGRALAAGGDDHAVHLWDITDQERVQELPTLTDPEGDVIQVAFSPDGRTLAAGSLDRAVHLWDITDLRRPSPLAGPLTGPNGGVFTVAFSPDGRTLAAGSADQSVRLWDVTDPAEPISLGRPLTGPNGHPFWLAFSPDGHTLATGNTDHTVFLWDLTRRRRPAIDAKLTGPTDDVLSVAFSPDGSELVASGLDKKVRTWMTDPGDVATYICATAGDPITATEWTRYVPDRPYQPPCRANGR